ncbi:MAG: hypothetical protein QN141_05300 [Armatimonadota bacterium]|nr:hypothetical protein [Armatimonadota bacterium]MDR7492759.1 hypothetical protein [Armatimonadota bacterium]MDR7498535.1 hypothetical protein [Armatimonadota bacterium]MDR7546789.1 hypothetical protein [Armatimonadota bacterium]MDR7557888.1 hypothetical protein [Armatimonadota bacterium]
MAAWAGVLTFLLVGGAATGATAHKGKLPEDALTLVRQASGLLAQNPAMTGEVKERLEAVLESKKTAGVNLGQVREALRALDRGDIAEARRLLIASIGPAGLVKPPEGPGRSVSSPAPAATGAVSPPAPAVQPPMPPSADVAMKMAEPLRVRFARSPVEIALLAAALALIGLGATSLRRGRGEVHS